jgi:sugar phosphate isomerase/epimerase
MSSDCKPIAGETQSWLNHNLLRLPLSSSRRLFVKSLPAVAFGASFLGNGQQSGHEPDLHFPLKPRDRLAVTSWPFRAYIESPTNRNRDRSKPGMDLTEFPAVVVAKFGVYNINPLSDHFRSSDSAYLDTFRHAVDKANSHIVDLGLAGRQFYAPDAATRRDGVEYGRKWIDIARRIGSPTVRQHVSGSPGVKPDVTLAAESLGDLAEYGSKRNIIVNLENDNPTAEDPFFLASIIQKVNSPYLRALPDFGNSLIGHDPEYNERAVRAMFKYAYSMCHVKDTVQGNAGERATVDLKKMFGIARESSFRGYFSMEFDTDAGDPFHGTETLVRETLEYM